MCGIVGVLSNEGWTDWQNRKLYAIQSLFVDTVRGEDSTGIFAAGQKDFSYYKRALSAPDFIATKRAIKILNNVEKYPYLIGHNRAATKGGVYDFTAHPFDFENVIGVHNGTIHNHRSLPNGTKYTVDSEAIFAAINDHGHEKILPEIDGAFALVWLNKEENKVYMIRNEERPLSLGYVKNKDTVLVASEGQMLRWIGGRNKFNLEKVESIRAGELYVFDKKNIKKPFRKMIKLKKKAPVVLHNQGAGNQNFFGHQGNGFRNGQGSQGTNLNKLEYDVLREMGWRIQETVRFVASSFKAYSGNNINGQVKGFVDLKPYVSIISHSAPKRIFDGMKEPWLVQGVVSSAYASNTYENQVTLRNLVVLNKNYIVQDPSRLKKPEIIVEPTNLLPAPDGNKKKFYGKRGEIITPEEWKKLVQDGCVNCTSNIDDEETGKVGFTQMGQVMCSDCVEAFGQHAFIPGMAH